MGGMYFYRNMFNFMPMPNAAFGSSFTTRQLAFAISAPKHRGTSCSSPTHCVAAECWWWCFRRRLVGGLIRTWFALLARCAALFARLVCCFVLAIGCLCPCWVHSSFGQRHPVWFVCCASRGHRFALGTGGLKLSLLVGGIGPVYSLPKLCFKPFRNVQCAETPGALGAKNQPGGGGLQRRSKYVNVIAFMLLKHVPLFKKATGGICRICVQKVISQ